MNSIIYLTIAVLATTIGAMAGLGGGVIIKPILDFLGDYDVATISVLSSMTVFTMAVVSIIKQVRYKFKLEIRKTVLLGLGSILGGLIGEKLLSLIISKINSDVVTITQNSILAFLLIFIFYYMNNKNKFKSYRIENSFICMSIGVFMGAVSSFLSIGGGPINVCMLTIFFSMNTKEAAVNSIITIIFSQLSKLVSIFSQDGLSILVSMEVLPLMMIGGVLGGIIGSRFNKNFSEKAIERVFNMVLILLVVLNSYNILEKVI
ncbi:MAG: sulfite exporter TauE/SafE family protein [Clostridium paraputrificum]